jgi:hypothetical protein
MDDSSEYSTREFPSSWNCRPDREPDLGSSSLAAARHLAGNPVILRCWEKGTGKGKNMGESNTAVRTLAYDWNIPWIDLYAALLRLPNHGPSPDGFHLSWLDPADFRPPNLNYGMATRNPLTLQALDAIWKSFPSEEEGDRLLGAGRARGILRPQATSSIPLESCFYG